MNQPDLFAPIARSDLAPSRDEVAARRRDIGIGRSGDCAQRIDPGWMAKAVGYVRLYATVNRGFLTEDVRAVAEADGLAAPADGRAWGAVMQNARHAGIVKPNGYAPAKSSNLSPKVRWESLVQA